MFVVFVRAVVTGFGFSVGAAIFKRLQKEFGLEEPATEPKPVGDGDKADDDPQQPPPPLAS